MRVPCTRLSRTSCLNFSVQRPAMFFPARWTTASQPASFSGSSGSAGFHCTSPCAGARRTSATGSSPLAARAPVSARPSNPEAPLMSTRIRASVRCLSRLAVPHLPQFFTTCDTASTRSVIQHSLHPVLNIPRRLLEAGGASNSSYNLLWRLCANRSRPMCSL